VIGIDRIILNKIKVNNFEALDKKEVCTNIKFSQYLEIKNDMYEFKYSHHLPSNGEEYSISSLDFNPNKVLKGNNIDNASITELIQALSIVIENIKKNGVEIDIGEVAIKYIEINKNIKISFESLQEMLLAVGRANFKRAFGQHSFLEEDIPKLIKKDRALYLNLREEAYNPERPENLAALIVYDKEFEMFTKNKITLGYPLTRVELKCGRDFYREEVKKLEVENSLEVLKNNPLILQTLFTSKVERYIFQEANKYIDSILKPNLQKDFISFKRTEKKKRVERNRLISEGKDIPQVLKEERGIYRYLEENSWIFDTEFLKEIIIKNMESNHRKRNLEHINHRYGHLKNYRLLERLSNELLGFF
jgi:hypothetical protein